MGCSSTFGIINLLSQVTNLCATGRCIRCDLSCVKIVAAPTMYYKLLEQFTDVTRPKGFPRRTKYTTRHHIETIPGLPVVCRLRRLASERLAVAKNEFRKLLKNKIIRSSKSSWLSPLHMVPKKDDQWRPCGDYRALNAWIIPDKFPVWYIEDFS